MDYITTNIIWEYKPTQTPSHLQDHKEQKFKNCCGLDFHCAHPLRIGSEQACSMN